MSAATLLDVLELGGRLGMALFVGVCLFIGWDAPRRHRREGSR